MGNKLPRFQNALTLVIGAATTTLLWLPCSTHAQSTATQSTATQSTAAQSTTTQDRQATAPQDRQAAPSDDITHRDLARFDQFLDSHREDAEQLRKTPSLINDPQFLQSHPELNAYLQEHPSVKQEISERPDTFMRLEDSYNRDPNARDRDAGGQDPNAARTDNRDPNARDRDAGGQNRDSDHRDVANFDRFLDGHREIAQQVRKDPSLLDNRNFVQSHPALQTYLQDNPGVRDQLRQNPNAFMQQADSYNRDPNARDRDAGGQQADLANRDSNARDRDAGGQDRNTGRRDEANFGRFLDGHREIAEQVRKDPSLLDNRNFVQSHPALQTYLQDNPGVRDQLRQDPNTFTQQAEFHDRDSNRDAMNDRMAGFGGFLDSHSDIRRDLSKDPNVVKDHEYVQNHAELNTYLNAHPDVRDDLMANPQSFVQGAKQYNNGGATGTASGAGVNDGRGTGTTGSSTGTSTNQATTHSKPNQ